MLACSLFPGAPCWSYLPFFHRFPEHKPQAIFGTGTDKDAKGMLKAVVKQTFLLRLVQANHGRASTIDALLSSIGEHDKRCQVLTDTPTVESALEEYISSSAHSCQKVIIVVTGSFYVVSSAREYLAHHYKGMFPNSDWVWLQDE